MTSTTREYETEVPGAAARPAFPSAAAARPVRRWPLVFIGAPAAVAVWSGWVGLGGMCGFGIIHPLPGIVDSFQINTAITLPIGVEAYGAYALGVWLRPGAVTATARTFAKRSAIGALLLGMAGQVIYHLLAAAHAAQAPWPVVMLVSCLPVVAIGLGAALTHLLHDSAALPQAAGPVRAQPPPGPARDRDGSGAGRTRLAVVRTPGPARADTIPHPADPGAGEPARAEQDAAPGEVDRDAVVNRIAEEIRDAVDSGDRWTPDYPALMAATGRRRRWCEKVVQEARDQVLDPPPDQDRDGGHAVTPAAPRSDRAEPSARADGHAGPPVAGTRTGVPQTRTDTAPGGGDARTGEPALAGAP